jgi:hypothetical protein
VYIIYKYPFVGLSKVTGPNKFTGFYILPRAENKAATVYTGQGKDICKVIRIKNNVSEQHWTI